MRLRSAAAVASLLVAFVACSDDDDADTSGPAVPTASTRFGDGLVGRPGDDAAVDVDGSGVDDLGAEPGADDAGATVHDDRRDSGAAAGADARAAGSR